MGWQDGTPVEKSQPAWMQGAPVRPKAPIETPQFEKDAAAIANATPAEVIAGNPVTRFAIGAGDLAIGAGQFIGNALGMGSSSNESVSDLQKIIDAGRKAYGSEGVDLARLGGNVLSPVGLKAASAISPAAGLMGRVGQGIAIGVPTGLATPVDNATDTADYFAKAGTNAAINGAVGAATPVAVEGVKVGYRSLRNILDGVLAAGGNTAAASRAGGRLANQVAGPNAAAVRTALENSVDNVPGSNLTAGQASVPANSAEFAALQKIAQQANPSAYAGTGVEGAQEAARRSLVQEVGQTPQALEAAQAARAADASRNYGAAYAQSVRADPQLAQMAQNPYFQDALATAQKLAEAKGIDPKHNLTEFLQLVKFGLDKQLGKTGDTALVGEERKAAYAAKKELVDWMGRKNPAYESARQEFAAASKPINQMEVGQELEKALVTPVGAGERPGVFANAVNNAGRTIKAATGLTGGPRFDKLEEVLTPDQVKKIQMVMQDLTQDAKFEELAGKGASQAGRIAGRALDVVPNPHFLSKASTIFNMLAHPVESASRDKVLKQLAIDMQNPKKMAQIMRDATPAERSQLVDFVMRLGTANAANVKEAVQ